MPAEENSKLYFFSFQLQGFLSNDKFFQYQYFKRKRSKGKEICMEKEKHEIPENFGHVLGMF